MNLAELATHYAQVKRRLYGATERRKAEMIVVPIVESEPEPIIDEPEPEPIEPPTELDLAHVVIPQWRIITKEVCVKYGVTFAEIVSHRKPTPVINARREAWWRIRHEVMINGRAISYPEIGRRFGKDHTTILHSVQMYERRK